jgi:hypothetical protein
MHIPHKGDGFIVTMIEDAIVYNLSAWQARQRQYLYFCTSKASKLGICLAASSQN